MVVNRDRTLNAIMSNSLLARSMKHWPYTWQMAYHFLLEWLAVNAPEKVPVLKGELCNDFYNSWSMEREEIFMAMDWVAEHYRRELENGIPLTPQTLEVSIRRELGMTFNELDIAPGHEPPQRPIPENFDFEDYLRQDSIETYGLAHFISAVLDFVKALEGWDPRLHKVAERLPYQDFSAGKALLTEVEQRKFAGYLATHVENYFI